MVVADVLVGFLCVVFLLFVIQSKPVGLQPPQGVGQFERDINQLKAKGGKFRVRSEFSKVHLTYWEKLLFEQCEWDLSPEGMELLEQHFRVFQRYATVISRIQIEGHADSRPAAKCVRLRRGGLRRDNWILSSLRALEVRDFLEAVLKAEAQDAQGSQSAPAVDLHRTLEAVGRGDLHPENPADPASEVNRRIEITVHFKETRGP